MVKDAAVKVLLTDNKYKHLLPSAKNDAICMDSDWPVIAQESTSNLSRQSTLRIWPMSCIRRDRRAQPKGVMILHGGLVNYLTWAVKTYAVQARPLGPGHILRFRLTLL